MKKINITIILFITIINFIFISKVFAVSPTVAPKLTITATPTKKVSTTPTASPSGTLTATPAEDEKVQEIRQAIKDKLNEIKDKIEKKAYVGTITEITDSTVTITNFRGKQRIRLYEETNILGANKKEITAKDLAMDDKIIALGEPDTNETLDAKRILVIAPLKTVPAKRLILYGTITTLNTKISTVTLTSIKDPAITVTLKIDKTTLFNDPKDSKASLTLKDLKESQKVIAIYPETTDTKTVIIAKNLFLLP